MAFSNLAVVLLTSTIVSSECNSGHPKILSFTADIQDKKGTGFLKGNDLILNCTVEGNPSTIQIKGIHDTNPLDAYTENQSLVSRINTSSCRFMGTYKCHVDDTEEKEVTVGINYCGPQPCKDDDVNRTIIVEVNESVNFSLCLRAYPGVLEHVQFNGTIVRKKLPYNWTWDIENGTSSYAMRVTHKKLIHDEYGTLNIRVFTSSGQQYYLDYNIFLRPPGPPDCPSDVNVTGQGVGYISLTWRPGLDGGFKQSFHVYFSIDNVTWYRHDLIEGETSANITGLLENTNYSVSVVSSNKLSMQVNASLCYNIILTKTGQASVTANFQSDDQEMDQIKISINPASFIFLAIGAALATLILLLVFFFIRTVRKHRQRAYDTGTDSCRSSAQHLFAELKNALD